MATSTLQVNALNDLYLPDGRNLVILSGVTACAQDIRLQTSMRLGEDIYDQARGVDFLGAIFTPQQSYDDARQSIISEILVCPDVVSIDSLTITLNENTFAYTANVTTIYGPLTVSST